VKSVIVHSEATEELDNAIKYYEKQKRGLGLDLLSEIEQSLEKIKINLRTPNKLLRI
jgi:toxin ParE1/3/4